MTNEQPEALRLAELLEKAPAHTLEDGTITLYLGGTVVADRAAAELRRLHAENEVHKNTAKQLAQELMAWEKRYMALVESVADNLALQSPVITLTTAPADEALLRQALAQLEINRTNFYKAPSKSICKMLAGGNDEVITAIKERLNG